MEGKWRRGFSQRPRSGGILRAREKKIVLLRHARVIFSQVKRKSNSRSKSRRIGGMEVADRGSHGQHDQSGQVRVQRAGRQDQMHFRTCVCSEIEYDRRDSNRCVVQGCSRKAMIECWALVFFETEMFIKKNSEMGSDTDIQIVMGACGEPTRQ